MCYISGGSPEGSSASNPGAIDPTPPEDARDWKSDWQLYFGRNSAKWSNGGVAFIQKPAKAKTDESLFRLYSITFEQFIDVLIQENGLNPHTEETLRESLIQEIGNQLPRMQVGETYDLSTDCLTNGWYRRLVFLGTKKGAPILSFTSSEKLDFREPADAYLNVIAIGLIQSFPMVSQESISQYLSKNSRISAKRAATITQNAYQSYLFSAKVAIRDNRDASDSTFGTKATPLVDFFRTIPTGTRENNKREYIIHLPNSYFEGDSKLRKRELLAISSWHRGKEYRVLATALSYPKTDMERYRIGKHEIAVDQKLRTAIGVRTGDWIGVYRLAKRKGSSWLYWSFESIIGTQPQIMRVYQATFEDMEADVARIPQSSFDLIGAKPGSTIALSSTTERAHARGLVLSNEAFAERKKQIQNEPGRYPDPRTDLELSRLRSGSGDADLPAIFIDYDLRKRLGVRPGDSLRVVRDSYDLFFSRIYLILFPILLGLVTAVLSFTHERWEETIIRIVLFIGITIAAFLTVIWEVRSKFRRK
ncbi:MAG: hypothetical protein AAGC73_04220 [Verrucomicrobiota bacterium]